MKDNWHSKWKKKPSYIIGQQTFFVALTVSNYLIEKKNT